jgi:lysophospholipase L1-like esterase
MSARSKLCATILITAGLILLLLMAAEAAIRVRQTLKYGSASTLENYYTVDRKINLRVPIANLSIGHISINSLGFRGPEIAVPKPSGTVRLAFLGASTTWCAEVSGNDFVWPHLVTASLRRTFPSVRFDYVNGGVPGYTMESLLKSIQYRVAPLQPDVIVIYEMSNNFSGELRELAAKRGIIREAKMQELTWPSRYSLLWNLVEKNLRIMAAQHAAETKRGSLEIDPGTLGEGYRHGLKQLVLAAQQSAKLVAIATFSTQLRRDQTPKQQARAASSAMFYTPFATTRLLIDGYERYNQIAREVASETGALLIQGENEIPADSTHFTDTVHFTDAGSRAMAERISRALVSSPRLRNLLAAGSVRQ